MAVVNVEYLVHNRLHQGLRIVEISYVNRAALATYEDWWVEHNNSQFFEMHLASCQH